MLTAGEWVLSQRNLIAFPLVDSNGVEVSGLGDTFTLQISKSTGGTTPAMGSFVAAAGDKGEIGSGIYWYLATADEADTPGPVFLVGDGTGIVQQNLQYVVRGRNVLAKERDYEVTHTVTGDPLEGVKVWFYSEPGATRAIWEGLTDAFGKARDADGRRPFLEPGTYTVELFKAGFTFETDTEVYS